MHFHRSLENRRDGVNDSQQSFLSLRKQIRQSHEKHSVWAAGISPLCEKELLTLLLPSISCSSTVWAMPGKDARLGWNGSSEPASTSHGDCRGSSESPGLYWKRQAHTMLRAWWVPAQDLETFGHQLGCQKDLPSKPFFFFRWEVDILPHSQKKPSALNQGHTEKGEGHTCCQGDRASAKGSHGKERKTDLWSRSPERVLSCRCECSPSGQPMYHPGPVCCWDTDQLHSTQKLAGPWWVLQKWLQMMVQKMRMTCPGWHSTSLGLKPRPPAQP